MNTSGLKAYRVAMIIAVVLAAIFSFIKLNVSNGILLSSSLYLLYLWSLEYGISKSLNDKTKHGVVVILLADAFFIAVLIGIGFFFDHVFSLLGILFGLVLCKILYVVGVLKA